MGKYRFRLSDMMPNAWFYKLKDMSHGARNNPNHRGGHHLHHHHKKKRRPSNSSASASTSASNASAAPSHIVPRLSNPPYNKYHSPSYRSHSPRLSDLYSPRNHKASDIPLPPPTPSSPTSRISSSSSTSIMLSKRSKSRKSLGHMPSPSPTRRPLQQQQQEETIIPPTTSRSLVTSNNTCNHHHMRYYSLSDGSPHNSLLWDESNSYCHHRHNNNSNIYGLVSSDEVGSRSSDSCRVSSSTADVIIDLNMDEDSYTNSEFQLVSEALDHELNSPTVLTDPAAIFNAYLDENNSTAGSRTGTMITTTTTTTTTASSKKSSCSKGQQFEEIECGGGPSSLHQLSVRINYVRSEERNISSSKRSCKEPAVKSNEVSSCSKYSSSSRRSRTVTMNTNAPPAAGPGGIRGVKLRLGTRTPRIACNKKVTQAQAKNGTRKSIILSANSPRRRMNSKNSKSTRRSSSCATSLSQSFAVVKSSCDPQRDFRESMTEMIVENNIRASRDLEDLLACYLTLNANEYHQLILKAFEQIWFHMFYDDDPSITDVN